MEAINGELSGSKEILETNWQDKLTATLSAEDQRKVKVLRAVQVERFQSQRISHPHVVYTGAGGDWTVLALTAAGSNHSFVDPTYKEGELQMLNANSETIGGAISKTGVRVRGRKGIWARWSGSPQRLKVGDSNPSSIALIGDYNERWLSTSPVHGIIEKSLTPKPSARLLNELIVGGMILSIDCPENWNSGLVSVDRPSIGLKKMMQERLETWISNKDGTKERMSFDIALWEKVDELEKSAFETLRAAELTHVAPAIANKYININPEKEPRLFGNLEAFFEYLVREMKGLEDPLAKKLIDEWKQNFMTRYQNYFNKEAITNPDQIKRLDYLRRFIEN